MNIGKWGNSLAVRLPKEVVDALGLKEGDEIKVTAKEPRHLEIERDQTREMALEKLKKLQRPLPPDYVVNREQANER